jgi:hypothetical protein
MAAPFSCGFAPFAALSSGVWISGNAASGLAALSARF